MKNRLKTISKSIGIVNEAKGDARFDIIIKPKNCSIDTGDTMYVSKGDSASMAYAYNEGDLFTRKQVDKELKKMEHGDPADDGYNWLSSSLLMDEEGKEAIIEIVVMEMKPIETKKLRLKPESQEE